MIGSTVFKEMGNNRKACFFIIALFLLYGIFYILYGEKVPVSVNNGLGWDGLIYGEAAKDFADIIISRNINSFHLQRILPSGIVYFIMKILSVDVTKDANVILTFSIYNFILILGSLFLWFKIVKKSNLTDRYLLLGVIAFLFAFPILKNNFYYPVLTDTTAFFIGFFTLWAYLNKYDYLLFLAAFIGAFTWPIVLFAIPLLHIFKTNSPIITYGANKWSRAFAFSFTIFMTLLAMVVLIKYRYKLHALTSFSVSNYLLFFSGLIGFGLFIHFMFKPFFNIGKLTFLLDFIKTTAKNVRWIWVIVYTILFFTVKGLALFYLPPEGVDFKRYIIHIIDNASFWPFYSLISHIVYYGPVFFIILFFWNRIMGCVFEYGIGLSAFFLINLIQVIDPQSRHFIFFLPFLVFYTFIALKNYQISNKFLLIFACIALFASKVWVKINTPEFLKNVPYTIDYTNESKDKVDINAIQPFFMNFGVFMSFKSYWGQLLVMIPLAGLLFFVYKYNKSRCKNCL